MREGLQEAADFSQEGLFLVSQGGDSKEAGGLTPWPQAKEVSSSCLLISVEIPGGCLTQALTTSAPPVPPRISNYYLSLSPPSPSAPVVGSRKEGAPLPTGGMWAASLAASEIFLLFSLSFPPHLGPWPHRGVRDPASHPQGSGSPPLASDDSREAPVEKDPGPLINFQPGQLEEVFAHTPQKSRFCKWTLSATSTDWGSS